jgi:NTE family protein
MNVRYASAFAAALATVIAGCASHRTEEVSLDLAPRFLSEVQRSAPVAVAEASRPTVGLVLGGGGLRGFAHVGVLRALEEAGIKPEIVVGTSAGAVVGAAYASGMTSAQIESAARNVRLSSLGLDLELAASCAATIRIRSTPSSPASHREISIRLAAVATDLQSEKAVLPTEARRKRHRRRPRSRGSTCRCPTGTAI